MRLARDPLLHFLIVGGCLFLLWQALHSATAAGVDVRTIEVDRSTLRRFIQFRTRSFAEQSAQQRLDAMSTPALTDLIADYVQEEALHRAALDLQLDVDDYVIRRRLVQKVEYLAEGVPAELQAPTEPALRAFYQTQPDRYAEPARITFTHVFFSAQRHGAAQARVLAQQTLEVLNRTQVPFTGSPGFGERFTYQLNYVDRPYDEIASHFGDDMAGSLFRLAPDPVTWQGVLESIHGSHLVLLRAQQQATVPGFETVQDRVLRDYRQQRQRARKEAFIADIVDRYRVEVAADLLPATTQGQVREQALQR